MKYKVTYMRKEVYKEILDLKELYDLLKFIESNGEYKLLSIMPL